MAIIQMELHIGQRNLILIAHVKENQRVIRAFLKCVTLDQIVKEVHSIGPIILKFKSYCLTKACAGEILILLTMA